MRTPTGTLLRAGLSVLVVVASVTACSGGDDPKPGTLATSKPVTTSASPTPSTPEAQIEATMREYFDAANKMFKTGDVSQVRSFSTSACPCRDITDRVQRIYAHGGHYAAGPITVKTVRVHDVDRQSGVAEVVARVTPYKVFNKRGKIIEDSKGGKVHADYSLVQEGDRWIIGNAFNLG